MDFSEETKEAAWKRSGGRCECVRKEHRDLLRHPFGRCVVFFWSQAGAEFHHLTAESVGGSNSLSNCEVLCRTCHRRTDSWGRRPAGLGSRGNG